MTYLGLTPGISFREEDINRLTLMLTQSQPKDELVTMRQSMIVQVLFQRASATDTWVVAPLLSFVTTALERDPDLITEEQRQALLPVIQVLGLVNDTGVVLPMRELVRHPFDTWSSTAARVLAALGSVEAIPTLIEALEPRRLPDVVFALSWLRATSMGSVLLAILEQEWKEVVTHTAALIPEDLLQRIEALSLALADLKEQRALSLLQTIYAASRPTLAFSAALALNQFGDSCGLSLIRKVAKSGNNQAVRWSAARQLVQLHEPLGLRVQQEIYQKKSDFEPPGDSKDALLRRLGVTGDMRDLPFLHWVQEHNHELVSQEGWTLADRAVQTIERIQIRKQRRPTEAEAASLDAEVIKRAREKVLLRRQPDLTSNNAVTLRSTPAPFTLNRTYLEHYLAGNYEEVWQDLRAQGAAVRTAPLYPDALAVARETMRRARWNIEQLVARLHILQYRFQYPKTIWNPPDRTWVKKLNRVEKRYGLLPLALRTWYEAVGSVCFIGSHPKLSEYAGHTYTGVYASVKHFPFSDPLVIDSPWTSPLVPWDELVEDARPQRLYTLSIAPDLTHKADYSGGTEMYLLIPNPAADTILQSDDWQDLSFVAYLRLAFKWGGFPAFEKHPREASEAVHELAFLSKDLLPI